MDKTSTKDHVLPSAIFYSSGNRKIVYQFPKEPKEKFEKFLSDSSLRQSKDAETLYPDSHKKQIGDETSNLLSLGPSTHGALKLSSIKKSPGHSAGSRFEIFDSNQATLSTISPKTTLAESGKVFSLQKTGDKYPYKEIDTAADTYGSGSDLQRSPLSTFSQTKLSETREKKSEFRFDNNGYLQTVENEEKSRLNALAEPNTDRSEYSRYTVADWKRESHRISEFASVFKDLQTHTNPAYELVMPKKSPRREQKIQAINGTSNNSLSIDNKIRGLSRRDLPKLLENSSEKNLSRDYSETLTYDRTQPGKKFNWETPNLLTPKPTILEETNGSNIPKTFGFLNPNTSAFDKKESVSHSKQDARTTAINFTRRAKKFTTEELNLTSLALHSPRSHYKDLKEGSKVIDSTANLLGEDEEFLNEFSPEALLHSLKRELPNIMTDAPSSRNDVLTLESWMSANLNKATYYSKLGQTEKLICSDEVYRTALNELIRQISCECIERGELIMRIWKNYIESFDGIVSNFRVEFEQKLQKKNEEIRLLQKKHSLEIEAKIQEILESKRSEEAVELKLQATGQQLREANARFHLAEDTIRQLKTDINVTKKQFLGLKRNHEDLLYKYHKIREDRDQKEDDEIDLEEVIMKKYQEFQAIRSLQELPDIMTEIKALGFEITSPLVESKTEQMQPRQSFGTFVGKKIEYSENATQTDEEAIRSRFREAETQTPTVLVAPKFDIVFEDMTNLDEIVKEEQLKRQIKEENIQDLEEDLQEEIYNQEYKKLKLKLKAMGNKNQDISDDQPDGMIYGENLASLKHPVSPKYPASQLGGKINLHQAVQNQLINHKGSLDSLDAIANKDYDQDGSESVSSKLSLEAAMNEMQCKNYPLSLFNSLFAFNQ